MIEKAVIGRPSSDRAMQILGNDIERVCGRIDTLEFKHKRVQQIADPGRRLIADRQLQLETRELKDQLRNLREAQDRMKRR